MAQAKTYLELVKDITLEVTGKVIYTQLETRESEAITQIVEDSYYEILDSRDWPYFLKFFTLTETAAGTPTKMTIPSTVKNIKYLKYNNIPFGGTVDDYKLVKFLEPQRFMNVLDARTTGSIASWTDTDGIKYKVFDDAAPTYYTSPDEQTIIFDSYDSAVDTFLTTAKSQAYGMKFSSVTVDDDFVFDLPPEAFSLLLAEAKAKSFRIVNKEVNAQAELYAQAQRAKFQEKPWKLRDNFDIRDFTTNPTAVGIQQQQQQQRDQGR